MRAMGMKFVGPVKIESADPGSKTVEIKANTREVGGQSNATGDVTISLANGSGTIDAVANVRAAREAAAARKTRRSAGANDL